MNALALVCNLYADGPRSLQRLREDGRNDLEDVLELSVDRLVELLGMSPRAAERFRREAETLGRRAGTEFLDPEHDRERRSPSDEAPAADGIPAELVPGVLDGLDAASCARLNEAGVGSLAQLVARDALDLSAAAGLPFAPVRRLQFLARRALAGAVHGDEMIPAPRASSARGPGGGLRLEPATEEEHRPAPGTTAPPRRDHRNDTRTDTTGARAAGKLSLAEGPRSPVAPAFEDELNRRSRDGAAGPFA